MTQTKEKPAPAKKKNDSQRVAITATRLSAVEAKLAASRKNAVEAHEALLAMLTGKEDSKSPIVAQVREIADLTLVYLPSVEDAANRIVGVRNEVRDLL